MLALTVFLSLLNLREFQVKVKDLVSFSAIEVPDASGRRASLSKKEKTVPSDSTTR